MRWGWLLVALLLSIVSWLVWLLPARVVIEPMVPLTMGQQTLQLEEIQGRLWAGNARWALADQQGVLGWSWGWQGLRPTLEVTLSGALELRASTLPGWKSIEVRRLDGRLPVAPWAPLLVSGATLEGVLSLQAVALHWRVGEVPQLHAGHVFFSGGNGRYGRESANLPALWGSVQPQAEGSELRVRNEQDTEVALLELAADRVSFKVLRTWALMLGASQGGAPDDIIFQTSFTF